MPANNPHIRTPHRPLIFRRCSYEIILHLLYLYKEYIVNRKLMKIIKLLMLVVMILVSTVSYSLATNLKTKMQTLIQRAKPSDRVIINKTDNYLKICGYNPNGLVLFTL